MVKLLASSSDDQTVRLWEVSTGHCLQILQGHTDKVRRLPSVPMVKPWLVAVMTNSQAVGGQHWAVSPNFAGSY
jgi:WD40 repeat protein